MREQVSQIERSQRVKTIVACLWSLFWGGGGTRIMIFHCCPKCAAIMGKRGACLDGWYVITVLIRAH